MQWNACRRGWGGGGLRRSIEASAWRRAYNSRGFSPCCTIKNTCPGVKGRARKPCRYRGAAKSIQLERLYRGFTEAFSQHVGTCRNSNMSEQQHVSDGSLMFLNLASDIRERVRDMHQLQTRSNS